MSTQELIARYQVLRAETAALFASIRGMKQSPERDAIKKHMFDVAYERDNAAQAASYARRGRKGA